MADEVYDDPKILTVFLPDGQKVLYKCDSRCPMMDLLVQITSIAKLKPTGFEIQPLSHDADDATVLPFNPNTQIGAIDTQVVRIAPRTSGSSKYRLNKATDHHRSGPALSSSSSTNFKNRVDDFNKLSGTSAIKICNNPEAMQQLSQPVIPSRNNYIASTLTPIVSGGNIGASCRVRVRLPRGQIHILRAAPQYPLQELYDLVCDERGLSPSKHILVYTDDLSKEVDLCQTLRECGTTELTMKALVDSMPVNTNTPKRTQHSSNIFSFLKKTLKKPAPSHANYNGTSSQGSSRRSSGSSSLPEATVKTGSRPYSMGSMEQLPNLHFTPINTIPINQVDEFKKPTVPKVPLRTAKRQAPRPPSIVVTQVNDQKDGSPTDDAVPWQDKAVRRSSQHSSDTGSAENSSVPSTLMRHRDKNHLPRAVSMGALDGPMPPRAMPRKKRAAPTPPMRMSHEDLHSPTLFEVQLCDKLDNIEERDTKTDPIEIPDPIQASPVTDETPPNDIVEKIVEPPEINIPKEDVSVEVNLGRDKVTKELIVPEENKCGEPVFKKVTVSEQKIISSSNIIPNDIPAETKIPTYEQPAEIIIHTDEKTEIDHNANNYCRNMLDSRNDPVDAKVLLDADTSAKDTYFDYEQQVPQMDSSTQYTQKDIIIGDNPNVNMSSHPLPEDSFESNSTLTVSSDSEIITHESTFINDTLDEINEEFLDSSQSQTKENNIIEKADVKIFEAVSDKTICEKETSSSFDDSFKIVDETPNEYESSHFAIKSVQEKGYKENSVDEMENVTVNNLVLQDIQRQESREEVHKHLYKSLNDYQANNNFSSVYITNNPVREQMHSPLKSHETSVSTKPIIIEEVYKSQPVVVDMFELKNKTAVDTKERIDFAKYDIKNKQSIYDEHFDDDKKTINVNNVYNNKHRLDDNKHSNDNCKESVISENHVIKNTVNGVNEEKTKMMNDVVDDAKSYSTPQPRKIYTPPKFMLTTWVDDKRPTNGSWETEENVDPKSYRSSVFTTTPPVSPAQTATKIPPKTLPRTVNAIASNTDYKIINQKKELPTDRMIPQVVGVIKRNPTNENSFTNGVKSTNIMNLGSNSELSAAKTMLRPVRTNSRNGSLELPKVTSNGNSASAKDKTALHAELLSHFVKEQPLNVAASTDVPNTDKPKQVKKKIEPNLNYLVSLPNYHNQAWRDRVPIMKPVFGKQLSMKDVAQVVKPVHLEIQSHMYTTKREDHHESDSPPSWILVKDANNLIKRNQSFGKNN